MRLFRHHWQIHFLLFLFHVSSQYTISLFRFISPLVRFSIRLHRHIVFMRLRERKREKASVCAWIFLSLSSFSFDVCLASCLNIATFVFICVFAYHVQMFHISCSSCICYLFSLCLCMLFALLNFVDFVYLASLCVQTVCIFIIFILFFRFRSLFHVHCAVSFSLLLVFFLSSSLVRFFFSRARSAFREGLLFLSLDLVFQLHKTKVFIFSSIIPLFCRWVVGRFRIISLTSHSIALRLR